VEREILRERRGIRAEAASGLKIRQPLTFGYSLASETLAGGVAEA